MLRQGGDSGSYLRRVDVDRARGGGRANKERRWRLRDLGNFGEAPSDELFVICLSAAGFGSQSAGTLVVGRAGAVPGPGATVVLRRSYEVGRTLILLVLQPVR